MRTLRRAAQGHADHVRHLHRRLPRDHRLPAVRPATSPRTRSSRRRSTRAAPGLDLRHRSPCVGAGITAFYMTRMVVMTFFGEKRWADDAHPHESPADHDRAAGRVLAVALGARRRLPDHRQPARRTSWPRSSAGREEAAHTIAPASTRRSSRSWWSPSASALAWLQYGTRPVPGVAPVAVTRSPPPPGATCTATPSTRRVFMRPGQYLTRFLVFFDNRGVDGVRERLGRVRRWHVRPLPSDADRLRPLLRPVHVRWRGRPGRRRRCLVRI